MGAKYFPICLISVSFTYTSGSEGIFITFLYTVRLHTDTHTDPHNLANITRHRYIIDVYYFHYTTYFFLETGISVCVRQLIFHWVKFYHNYCLFVGDILIIAFLKMIIISVWNLYLLLTVECPLHNPISMEHSTQLLQVLSVLLWRHEMFFTEV